MNLVSKYNVPVPRYTSYPTVPFWDHTPTEGEWLEIVNTTFQKTNSKHGISLYIHLPFCESLCTYCACNTRITVNHAVEIPYINAIIKEWKIYLNNFNEKPCIRELHLGRGTPTFFSAENLDLLLTEILKDTNYNQDSEFSFEGHPSNTGKQHLETLFKFGFKRISLGIQDYDLKVQDAINRFQSPQEVEDVVRYARQIGYTSVNFDLVYGLPFQNENGFKETIKKVLEVKPERIALYSYAHVPWLKPGQRKFTEMDLPVDEVKQNLYKIGKEMFLNAGYKEVGMDHFALENDLLFTSAKNGTLHRNFMGYTPHHTELLIGLGASSISDAWGGFIQNIKTVEEYQRTIENGHLAIFKGHILTEEDMVIRKHILNLMCNGSTNWKDKMDKCDELYFVLDRLKAMKKDGLVELSANEVRITDLGKTFLRNICLCFDARYWAKTPEAKIFSSAI
ncbi:MAG: oxygen-independent coproporphyrinogen III oxidase [Bacteroidia bacterium]|nr:oxygen-independent coproporphyrinogen III oxidase [Bacteroidia bacterium]